MKPCGICIAIGTVSMVNFVAGVLFIHFGMVRPFAVVIVMLAMHLVLAALAFSGVIHKNL